MKILFFFLGLLDKPLKLIIQPKSNRICYTSMPDYSDNSYHQYKYNLRYLKDIEHVWLIKDQALRSKIKTEFETAKGHERNHSLIIASRWHPFGYLAFLRSIVTFHTHGVYFFSSWNPKRIIVGLWHGMPIKAIGQLNATSPNPKPTHASLFIANNSLFQYIIACCFNTSPKNVLICEQPRCDILRQPELREYSSDTIKSSLRLQNDQRFGLWMPTYRTEPDRHGREAPKSFLNDTPAHLISALNEAAKKNNVKIVVKLHPYDVLNQEPIDMASYDHITVIRSQDWEKLGVPLYELIAQSEFLLSDISSVLIDYMALNRPIGVIGYNPSTYTRETLFPPEWLLESKLTKLIQSEIDCDFLFSDFARTDTDTDTDTDTSYSILCNNGTKTGSATIIQAINQHERKPRRLKLEISQSDFFDSNGC